jgi:hypothetical protein
MRLWSIHPQYLDSRGLVALWREGLLARKVLFGKTKGYRNHPQLERFKKHANPLAALGYYLHEVCDEARKRGYHFNRRKIGVPHREKVVRLPIPRGQINYEFRHLRKKLRSRAPRQEQALKEVKSVKLHPLFYPTNGRMAAWERKLSRQKRGS